MRVLLSAKTSAKEPLIRGDFGWGTLEYGLLTGQSEGENN